MLPTHFHKVIVIYDHNIVKMFGLYKILTTILLHRDLIRFTPSLFLNFMLGS